MTGFEFGDVVLIRFPFTSQRTGKQRPAVVVSSEAYHQSRPDLLIMAITSRSAPASAMGEAEISGWREAGLLKPSTIKPLIATIEPGLIRRKLGRLLPDDLRRLRAVLDAIIGAP